MKLEKLVLKRKKCWVFACKKCGEEQQFIEHIEHFDTKTEAFERLEEEAGEDYNIPNCECWKND